MNVYLCLLLVGVAFAQEEKPAEGESVDVTDNSEGGLKPRIYRRMIPADVLRDFPNYCFASTSCKLYEPGQDWDLAPFCGRSHCMFDPALGKYLEVVFDCGPKPTNPDECKILKSGNTTDTFPQCCDVYDLKTCEFPIPKINTQGAGGAPPGEGSLQGADATEADAAETPEEPRRPTRPRTRGRPAQ
ncbi:unnamed protein product [Cyprideis torosa]|uniref:Uncharacterized protein n=1 Tax=Cyprideis torosa TaxID=163714 RepID=A0A7R8ZGD2_9CRUS|nr:unnamed protein product [Cyprideis torosa]CAG0881382.1 unnamed protein product [Cyprideis torosa]